MKDVVSIGLVQVGTEPFEVQENRATSVEMATRVLEKGADIVVLPEMVIHGYVADSRALALLAEPVDGPTVSAWLQLAATYESYVCGGFCERDGNALYNTAVIVGPSGIILHYRKLHLFRDEKTAFRPGDLGLPIAHTPFGTIGLCVCYDLRFVEVARILALRSSVLICVPTAWLPGFDQEKWDEQGMCPQAYGVLHQANLNQTFIACASQVGNHGNLEFLGSSLVADPYGKLVAGPLSKSENELVVVEVDIDAAKRALLRDPLITPRADRRTDVYELRLGDEIL